MECQPRAEGLPPAAPPGSARCCAQARIAQGLSLFVLAHELNLSVPILEAMEAEAWDRLPLGARAAPHPADRRAPGGGPGLLLRAVEPAARGAGAGAARPAPGSTWSGSWWARSRWAPWPCCSGWWCPAPASSGAPRAPRREARGRAAPRRGCPRSPAGPYPGGGRGAARGARSTRRACSSPCAPWTPAKRSSRVAQGRRPGRLRPSSGTLRISEPWRLRVKGPFTIALDNGGVVALEVAGRSDPPGPTVGEPWKGRFGPHGRMARAGGRRPRTPRPRRPETGSGRPTRRRRRAPDRPEIHRWPAARSPGRDPDGRQPPGAAPGPAPGPGPRGVQADAHVAGALETLQAMPESLLVNAIVGPVRPAEPLGLILIHRKEPGLLEAALLHENITSEWIERAVPFLPGAVLEIPLNNQVLWLERPGHPGPAGGPPGGGVPDQAAGQRVPARRAAPGPRGGGPGAAGDHRRGGGRPARPRLVGIAAAQGFPARTKRPRRSRRRRCSAQRGR